MSLDNEVVAELDLGEPPKELLDWAKEHLGENPDTRCQIISDFRDMIYARGECTPHRTDDAFLLRFLRARSFIIERAHRLLVNYYDFKENNPQFCDNIDLVNLKKIGADKIILVPPYREASGRRIMNYRVGNWAPDKYTIEEMFQATIAVLEMAVMEQRAQILGGICIFDFGGLSMQQAWHMTPSLAHKVIQIMVTCFPMRIHALHIVNQSYVFDVIYNIFKPFLNEAMKERIFFHGDNLESLHKHIDPKYLPERYGGIHPDYDYEHWVDSCRKNSKIVEELKALGYKDSELDGK
ncbi:alpha-tocopherol transfer protein-like isoform X2 [Tribolium castaneum]|uniref:Alpha-tocopherol transfer protein-like n=2 Tax=Tribolium castaneum TaxID=7070 RepID=D6WK77_TRICA|nr:PREDICTED: alpha-tocopherol transfer protein-like isoform X2 [Tribolium castaneum]XP_968820.1 PREDICTED: alpha-tocopherol transfer protein-like isoform X2 [Tribolium castaneum]EFA03949.1 Alpha-tocopherol transfer protein-like [Tribolium castaneum]|eukprot:XP_008193218.1 PREDICTED: alpha-tocopherol transfer protein-like isoform X2 [Tribolium castaneum]